TAAAEVGAAERDVEPPDVLAGVGETGGAVGEAIEREVARDRLAVELRLEPRETLAALVQVKRAAGRHSDGVDEVLAYGARRPHSREPGELLPVAVDLEPHLPSRRRAAQREAGLPPGTRRDAAVLAGGHGAALLGRESGRHGLERVQDLDAGDPDAQARDRRRVVAPAGDDRLADHAREVAAHRRRHVHDGAYRI